MTSPRGYIRKGDGLWWLIIDTGLPMPIAWSFLTWDQAREKCEEFLQNWHDEPRTSPGVVAR